MLHNPTPPRRGKAWANTVRYCQACGVELMWWEDIECAREGRTPKQILQHAFWHERRWESDGE